MAKSGRPPSETRVLIFSLECAAVRNADVASILAPKKTMGSLLVLSYCDIHCVVSIKRSLSKSI
jgi:hypothetical protein